MKKNKSQLDEMQEQKLLKIEHNGCWFAFWALLVAMGIQVIIGGEEGVKNATGEWIVFMCLAIYMAGACIKNGIWDRKLKPNLKTNLIISVIAGLVAGIFGFIDTYVKYHKMVGSIATGGIMFFNTFILCILVFGIMTVVFKKRKEKLEGPDEEA